MQCGSVIALDKSHSGSGNPYWETSRLRPDLVLMDLVKLVHPDVAIDHETTFMRILPPPANSSGVPACPRALLPVVPDEDTVHVTSRYLVSIDESSAASDAIGAPHFAVLNRFYPFANGKIAEALGIDKMDLKLAMANEMQEGSSEFDIAVTVRVRNCEAHSCAVEVGQKLDAIGSAEIERSLDLSGVSVERDPSKPTLVRDREGDVIPLADLVVADEDAGDTSAVAKPEVSAPDSVPTAEDPISSADDAAVDEDKESDSEPKSPPSVAANNEGEGVGNATAGGLGSGAIAGIIVAAIAAMAGIFAAYKAGFAEGAKATQLAHDQKGFSQAGPDSVA